MARLGALMHATFKPGVRRGLKRMIRRSKEVRVVLRKLRKPLQEDLSTHAEREASPDGRWPRRSRRAGDRAGGRRARVIRGRSRKAGKRVGARQGIRFVGGSKLLGQLPDTVTVKLRRGTLTAKSPIPWSGAHNDGARVGRGAKLPAREFVFLSPDFLQRAEAALADHIVGGWASRGRSRGARLR